MTHLFDNLFVGNESDCVVITPKLRPDVTPLAIVHACKDPCHRRIVGYTGRSCPSTHPEYLIARRGLGLYLNLIDAPDRAYIPDKIVDATLAFIAEQQAAGHHVLVHCNQGMSRAPTLAFVFLFTHTGCLDAPTFERAESLFGVLYPDYLPGGGMRAMAREYWERRKNGED